MKHNNELPDGIDDAPEPMFTVTIDLMPDNSTRVKAPFGNRPVCYVLLGGFLEAIMMQAINEGMTSAMKKASKIIKPTLMDKLIVGKE